MIFRRQTFGFIRTLNRTSIAVRRKNLETVAGDSFFPSTTHTTHASATLKMLSSFLLAVLVAMAVVRLYKRPRATAIAETIPSLPSIPMSAPSSLPSSRCLLTRARTLDCRLGSLPYFQKSYLLSLLHWSKVLGPVFWVHPGLNSPILVVASVKAAKQIFPSYAWEERTPPNVYKVRAPSELIQKVVFQTGLQSLSAQDLFIWEKTSPFVKFQHRLLAQITTLASSHGHQHIIDRAALGMADIFSGQAGRAISRTQIKWLVEDVMSAVSLSLAFGFNWSAKQTSADGRAMIISNYFHLVLTLGDHAFEWGRCRVLTLHSLS